MKTLVHAILLCTLVFFVAYNAQPSQCATDSECADMHCAADDGECRANILD
jgi:hypothetical protein